LPPRRHSRALCAVLLFAQFKHASENQSKVTYRSSQEETQEVSLVLVPSRAA
jgi:hypothetical protein